MKYEMHTELEREKDFGEKREGTINADVYFFLSSPVA